MNIDNSDIAKILELRKSLVLEFESYKDYKSNKNAIMKEWDHVASLEKTIKKLDDFLSKFVKFS